jgi:hypothetical protein
VNGHDRPLALRAIAPEALLQGVGSAASRTVGIARKVLVVTLPVAQPTKEAMGVVARKFMELAAGHPDMKLTEKAATDTVVEASAAADKAVADAGAAAGAEVITNTAPGFTTTAMDLVGRTAVYPARAVMKVTAGNPVVKAASTIWLGSAVRAASTPVAQAMVDSALDTVVDVAIDVGVDTGREMALKVAQAAVRDIATTATDLALNMVALAEVTPVTSAAADVATLAATRAVKSTAARSTAHMTSTARNAVTLAATRATGSAMRVAGADALQDAVGDVLKAAIKAALKAAFKAAVTEAVKETMKSTGPSHLHLSQSNEPDRR